MPRPTAALRPVFHHGGHVHEEHHHLEAVTCLLIVVGTDRLRVQNAEQARLFPRFLQSHLLGQLAAVVDLGHRQISQNYSNRIIMPFL